MNPIKSMQGDEEIKSKLIEISGILPGAYDLNNVYLNKGTSKTFWLLVIKL